MSQTSGRSPEGIDSEESIAKELLNHKYMVFERQNILVRYVNSALISISIPTRLSPSLMKGAVHFSTRRNKRGSRHQEWLGSSWCQQWLPKPPCETNSRDKFGHFWAVSIVLAISHLRTMVFCCLLFRKAAHLARSNVSATAAASSSQPRVCYGIPLHQNIRYVHAGIYVHEYGRVLFYAETYSMESTWIILWDLLSMHRSTTFLSRQIVDVTCFLGAWKIIF